MMKTSLKTVISLVLAITLFAVSCKKPAEHSIRVKNDSSLPIQTIKIEGSAIVFKDVKANTATDYQAIPEGTYTLSGDLSLSGSFDISGKGKHKWSIVIANGGGVTITDEGK